MIEGPKWVVDSNCFVIFSSFFSWEGKKNQVSVDLIHLFPFFCFSLEAIFSNTQYEPVIAVCQCSFLRDERGCSQETLSRNACLGYIQKAHCTTVCMQYV